MTYRAPKSTAPLYAPPREVWTIQCWACGVRREGVHRHSLDALIAVPPEDGQIFLCECSQFSIFDRSMPDNLRKPSPKELDAIHEKAEQLLLEHRHENPKKAASSAAGRLIREARFPKT